MGLHHLGRFEQPARLTLTFAGFSPGVGNKETLEKNPGLVQRFLRATQKSIAYAEKNPDESVAAIGKIKPDLDKDLALKQLKAGLALQRATDGANQSIGWM